MNPFVVQQAVQRAYQLHSAGRAVEAWTAIAPHRKALDRDPQGLGIYALVAQAAGQVDAAVEALLRLYDLNGRPAPILGAIADTYDKAGRHEAAFDYWQKLVARDPTARDAHLNAVVSASSANRFDAALQAAEAGLARFPGDARLLAAKAMALKNLDRTEEAVALFEIAVAADPNRALTRANQAVALRAAYRGEEACAAFAAAEKLGMNGAEFYNNWAGAALEAMAVDDAAQLYERALALDPTHDEARRGLTRLAIEYRHGERAFEHYRAHADRNPRSEEALRDWAQALLVNRRYDEALAVAERGLTVAPTSSDFVLFRSFARGLNGDRAVAAEEYARLKRIVPPESQGSIVQLGLRAGQAQEVAAILERQVAADPLDQLAWAMLGIAWRLTGDPREAWLCDYDRLVMVTDVTPVDGSSDAATYARAMAEVLDGLHVASAEPGDQSLRGGTQTSGKLFGRPDPRIQQFREAIEAAAARAVAALPNDPSHPFLSRKSTHFRFAGSWSVRLAVQGHHVSHVHPEGWMSSAYYARLPAQERSHDGDHRGWIQFGAPPEHLGIDLAPRRLVEPVAGRLVLFPSYFWHGTVPFDSGDRLTAAFDYLPA